MKIFKTILAFSLLFVSLNSFAEPTVVRVFPSPNVNLNHCGSVMAQLETLNNLRNGVKQWEEILENSEPGSDDYNTAIFRLDILRSMLNRELARTDSVGDVQGLGMLISVDKDYEFDVAKLGSSFQGYYRFSDSDYNINPVVVEKRDVTEVSVDLGHVCRFLNENNLSDLNSVGQAAINELFSSAN